MSRSLHHAAVVVVLLVSLAGCQSPPSGTSTNPAPTSAASAKPASPSLSDDDLAQRTMERRAVDAVVWAMPAVNFELMYQAMVREAKGDFNQIVYWSRLPTWKNQTLTPNPDAVYLMPFYNTEDLGPMVLEIPPASTEGSITGNIDDGWQVALEDVGPAGVDKGKGCKCVILPPGYAAKLPAGYIPLPSATFSGYALLRSILTSGTDADIAKAVAYGRRVKFYPLSQAANPPATQFHDAIDVVFDSTIPYDVRFFETLDRFVQREPWLDRDRAMIDPLKTLGIEKGKAFSPDATAKARLEAAAREAHAWLEHRYESAFPPFNEGHHWAVPALPDVVEGQSTGYAKPDVYPTDARALTYSIGFVGIKHLGAGQFYLMTIADKDGQPLNGGQAYRLVVPPNAPVTQYWSATVYDRATHAFIRNMDRFSRSSQVPDLQKNADGSVDLYFGPTAPAGKESNWVPTSAQVQFEVLFRLYGPGKPLYDKTWILPDVEKVTR